MADTFPQKSEYDVAGHLLYRCLHFQLQENTYIQSQIQFIQTRHNGELLSWRT